MPGPPPCTNGERDCTVEEQLFRASGQSRGGLMRILAISNLYPPIFIGGYELCCHQAVDALRRRGHEARVLTSRSRAAYGVQTGVDRALQLTKWFDLDLSVFQTPGEWRR